MQGAVSIARDFTKATCIWFNIRPREPVPTTTSELHTFTFDSLRLLPPCVCARKDLTTSETSPALPTSSTSTMSTTNVADAGPALVGVSLSLVALATILVVTRIFYRVKSHAFGWDDGLIIAAVIFSIGHSVADCICTLFLALPGKPELTNPAVYTWGYGRHKADLTPAQAHAPGQSLVREFGDWCTERRAHSPRDSGSPNLSTSWSFCSQSCQYVFFTVAFSRGRAGRSRFLSTL